MSSRTAQAKATLEVAAAQVPSGSCWDHRKGGRYVVIGHALDTDDGTARVIYKRVGGPEFNLHAESGIAFARPLSEWTPERFAPAKWFPIGD